MKKHRRSVLESILAVQSAPVVKSEPYRRLTDRQKFDEEEKIDAENRLQALLAPQRKEMAIARDQSTAATTEYWAQSSVSRIAADLQKGNFYPDLIVDYPKTDQKQGGEYGKAQYVAFLDKLPASGFSLSEVGKQRLLLYALSNALGNGANMADPIFWQKAFDRLLEIRAFEGPESTELGFDETQRVEIPAPCAPPAAPLTLADLEGIDCSSRSGEAAARDIINTAVFGHGGEAKTVWDQWVAHLEKDYGFVPTAAQQKAAIDWFTRNQKSFVGHSDSYNECRRYMTRTGLANWPPNMLTADEQMAQTIENEDSRSYEGRTTLKQKLALLSSIQKR